MKEALYYRVEGDDIRCMLCPHYCRIGINNRGICRNRIHKEGKLYTLAFGNVCAAHIDPIEKKPLYHFLPGTEIFSVAFGGCNMGCLNCQNHSISQTGADQTGTFSHTPEEIVEICLNSGYPSIAYTYTEPAVFYEFMLETAVIARKKKIKNVMISNGFINPEPLRKLIPFIDAFNIDIKCFDESIYKVLNKASLQPVLNTLLEIKNSNCWLEITNLIIPGLTDDVNMIRKMCAWIKKNGMGDCPVHFSRFFPTHKLSNSEATAIGALEAAAKTAKEEGLNYVYVGNVYGSGYENTICPLCSKEIIKRSTRRVHEMMLSGNACKYCGYLIAGVWK